MTLFNPLTAIGQDPTGWDDSNLVTESYNSTTRVVTVSGTGKLYWQGRLVHDLALGNLVSAAHTATNGGWFYYYNGTAFTWLQTPWTFNLAMICYVQYVSATPANSWALRECHSTMNWQSHQEFHNTLGCYRASGGAITAIVPGSNTASERRPALSAVVLMDEDLMTTNPLLAAGAYTQMYVGAASAATFVIGAGDIVPLSTAIPRYNNVSAGTLVDLTANQYVNVWLLAMPTTSDTQSQAYRYLWVTGQAAGTLAVIDAETPAGVNLGSLTTQSAEFVFIARVLIRYTAGDWLVTSVTQLYGTRYQQTGSGAAPVDLSAYAALAGATFTGTVVEEAEHSDKVLTAPTLPASGYTRMVTLSTGERRMKLSDGTELCDFVRLGAKDYWAESFLGQASASVYNSGTLGYGPPIALSTGTWANFSPHAADAGRLGIVEARSSATANSGCTLVGPYNVGPYAYSVDYVFAVSVKPLHSNFGAVLAYQASQGVIATDAMAPGGRFDVSSLAVTGRAMATATAYATAAAYSLTVGTWYTLIMVKRSANAWTFAVINEDSNAVEFMEDLATTGAQEGSGMRYSMTNYYGGTPGGATPVSLIDTMGCGNLAGWRRRTGIAALPKGASLLTFY